MRWWWQPPCLLRQVLVNLVHEPEVLRGVLFQTHGAWLVLKDVSLIGEREPVRMDGDVVIHRDQVSFIQVL